MEQLEDHNPEYANGYEEDELDLTKLWISEKALCNIWAIRNGKAVPDLAESHSLEETFWRTIQEAVEDIERS